MARFPLLGLFILLFLGISSAAYQVRDTSELSPIVFELLDKDGSGLAEIKGTLSFRQGSKTIPVSAGTGNLEWTSSQSGEKHIFVSGEKGRFNGQLEPGVYKLIVRAAEGEQITINQFHISKEGHYRMFVELGQAPFLAENWPPTTAN